MLDASRSRDYQGQNISGDSPLATSASVPAQNLVFLPVPVPEEYLRYLASTDKDKDKDKRRHPAKQMKSQFSKPRGPPSDDSEGSISEENDRIFDKAHPSGSESVITNPESSPATESAEELPSSWPKPVLVEPRDFVLGC